jgi:hypothetical protein
MDIGQGAGLAGAAGTRPFLPPLLAGGLARGDIGIDFDGTGWEFLESPAFLLTVFALAAAWFVAERSGLDDRWARRAVAVAGLALGGLLFGGSIGTQSASFLGVVAGVACAALAFVAVNGLLDRAARRLDDDAAGFLDLYAEAFALALAGVAIFLPPVSFLALAGFVLVLLKARAAGDRKYAGLRILR